MLFRSLPDVQGAIIIDVVPESPAAHAGLRTGDVIRSFNGRRVEGMQQFQQLIAGMDVGREVELGILRQGAAAKVKARIAEMPPEFLTAVPAP